MPFVQNISEENQLLRVLGTKQVVKPGEIAEVTETELKTAQGYSRLFAHVDEAGEKILSDREKKALAREEERSDSIQADVDAQKAAKKAAAEAKKAEKEKAAGKKEKDVEPPKVVTETKTEGDKTPDETKKTEGEVEKTPEGDKTGEADQKSTSQDSQGGEQK